MNYTSVISKIGIYLAAGVILTSCTKDPNSPGYEYMPDMYRSASVEAYVDYTNPDVQSAKLPPAGTIPFSEDPTKAWINFPYAYPEDATGYEMVANIDIKNPVPYSEEVVAQGEEIYLKFCSHCHGEKGDGKGQIALNGKIDGIPAFKDRKTLTDGQIFHSVSYGKGVMGAHAPLLNKEERWKIIHWIRSISVDGYPNTGATATADSTATETPAEVQP